MTVAYVYRVPSTVTVRAVCAAPSTVMPLWAPVNRAVQVRLPAAEVLVSVDRVPPSWRRVTVPVPTGTELSCSQPMPAGRPEAVVSACPAASGWTPSRPWTVWPSRVKAISG